ncbi:MAG: serine/threonine-protein kinase [Planctomycetaceae bacterium]
MSEPRRCPQCDAEIPLNSPAGLCPRCLLKANTDSQSVEVAAEPAPTKLTPPASGFIPPAVEELAPLFPQLEILELLGKGGMGAVYKARQPGLDRLVAVKILPPEISYDPAFTERFQREARALARLSHPHIVAVYDFGMTERVQALCYIVMEFVDGANLRQAIQSKTLTSAEALAIVPQICEALQFAHDEGIVHRDIKPENILIDKRGRVKIADFGLAKLLDRSSSGSPESPSPASLTATNQVMGTLRYMAPEQMQGSRAVDHRADIYSLGVVFYELLTGELPMGRFAPPSKRVQVDVRLDEIVLRTLEQDPEQRYQHASEVKTDVEHVSRHDALPVNVSSDLGQPTSVPPLTAATPASQPRLCKLAVLSAVWAMIGLLCAVAICVWLLS